MPLIVNILITAQLVYGSSAVAEGGFPLLTNYSAADLKQHPQNWDIIQDSRGNIYIANNGGINIFDGTTWQRIRIPNSVVRSLAIDDNGVIYVGGKGELGRLVPDSIGSCSYESLVGLIDSLYHNFKNIYQIVCLDESIIFRSSEYLLKLTGNRFIIIKPKTTFSRMFVVDNRLYIRERNIGLKTLESDTLKFIRSSEVFGKISAMSMNALGSSDIMIGTPQLGFIKYNGTVFDNIDTELNDFIIRNRIYNGIDLSDHNFAFTTLDGGVVITDKELNALRYFNTFNGLQDNNVKNLFQDRQGNIWLALQNGISKIEYSSPFTVYDDRANLKEIILSIAKHDGELYVGNAQGLQMLSRHTPLNPLQKSGEFIDLPGIEGSVWSLITMNEELIIGSSNGIYIKKGTRLTKLSDQRTYSLLASLNNTTVFAGTFSGLYKFDTGQTQINIQQIYPEVTEAIRTIVEGDNGNLWLGTLSQGVINIKVNDNKVVKYDTSSGLPPGEINIFKIAGRPRFATNKGLFTFDSVTMSFIPDRTFGNEFADGLRGVFRIAEDDSGNVYIHSNSNNFLAIKNQDGTYSVESKVFRRLKNHQVNTILTESSGAWFGTHENLVYYDRNIEKQFLPEYPTLIKKVFLNSDSLIYGGLHKQNKGYEPIIDYNNRNIRFEYISPFYEGEDKLEYQYKLDGYDNRWSEWSVERRKDYTNLSEGDYTFNVRAKNVYEDISNEATFSFKILPPYYRTVWAYIVYLLMLIAFGYVVVKWRINKLEKEKENLIRLVDEQTYEIKEQAEKLKELDKIKSRFFANISHEFRTPLTLIIGPTEQMLIDEQSKDKRKSYSLILRNSKKLLGLINKLLDLSKIQSGNMKLNLSRVDIVRFAREITAMFDSLADQKKLKLNFYSAEEEIPLVCDSDKIEKILVNLLSNAIKFTDENGIVSVKLQMMNTGFVSIGISDTGIGITNEELKHIFDPFFQADTTSRRKFSGTGIGLSLVKEFVELHGGTVSVQSKNGRGTEFIIQIPSGLKDNGEIEGVPSVDMELDDGYLYEESDDSADPAGSREISEDRNTILIVEDNSDARNYIIDNLKNEYNIAEAGNGLEGFERAKDIVPDLIISDVMMPGTNGFEFCRKVKSTITTSHIPVILLTAKAGDESIVQGLETGADDYITKPFNIQILQTRIRNLIELRSQLQHRYKRDALLQPSEIKVSSLDDKFLKQLHDLIEKNIANPDLDIEMFCDKFLMSRTSLFRKIKALTGEPPKQFLRTYRLKRAAQLLKQGSGNVTEIAFDVGFNDSGYFTRCFKKEFNQLPSDFQQKEST